jgi:hypothetical protein
MCPREHRCASRSTESVFMEIDAANLSYLGYIPAPGFHVKLHML